MRRGRKEKKRGRRKKRERIKPVQPPVPTRNSEEATIAHAALIISGVPIPSRRNFLPLNTIISFSVTLNPGSVTTLPLTVIFPSLIKGTASLREPTPQCAINLFKGISLKDDFEFIVCSLELVVKLFVACCLLPIAGWEFLFSNSLFLIPSFLFPCGYFCLLSVFSAIGICAEGA